MKYSGDSLQTGHQLQGVDPASLLPFCDFKSQAFSPEKPAKSEQSCSQRMAFLQGFQSNFWLMQQNRNRVASTAAIAMFCANIRSLSAVSQNRKLANSFAPKSHIDDHGQTLNAPAHADSRVLDEPFV
jgi:hypothetical protein